MPDFEQDGKEGFCHISRQAEIVVIKDRDVMAFIPESVGIRSTEGMIIQRENTDGGGDELWKLETTQIEPSERVLLWSRMSGTEMVSGFRWVPYICSSDPTVKNIKPIRECYAPRVTYDKESNTLHLWFWTNVKWDYSGTAYDEAQLVPIGYNNYESLTDYDNDKMTCKRVLCYATGYIGHYNVTGGFFAGYEGILSIDGILNIQNDMIPIFTKPVIITNYSFSGLANASGIITDGFDGFIASSSGGSSTGDGSGPWWITISGDTITCSDCVYMRGTVTLEPSVASLTLALTDDAYIAGHINLEYGTAVLFEGNSLQAVTDATPQDDDTIYKLLLYKLHKVNGSWKVRMDYRAVPQLGSRL
jgi:hypothetical protein